MFVLRVVGVVRVFVVCVVCVCVCMCVCACVHVCVNYETCVVDIFPYASIYKKGRRKGTGA